MKTLHPAPIPHCQFFETRPGSCILRPMTRAKDFFSITYPELFNRGIKMLEEKAGAGDAKATEGLADTRAATGALYVKLVGEPSEVYLFVDGGVSKSQSTAPAGPVRVSIEADSEQLDRGLDELEKLGVLSRPELPVRVARLASKKLEAVLGSEVIEFHLTLLDTPDYDEVKVKVCLNGTQLSDKPRFAAVLKYEDLEAAMKGKLQPQQLLMGGKVKITGDANRAMALGMQMMQAMQAK